MLQSILAMMGQPNNAELSKEDYIAKYLDSIPRFYGITVDERIVTELIDHYWAI